MDPDLPPALALLVPLLVAVDALFVAAEFALLTLRVRPETRGRNGEARLPAALTEEDLALTAQLGSTLSTLTLGFVVSALVWAAYGGAAVREISLLGASLALPRALALALALGVLALLHTVLGAQLPRLAGVQRAEWVERRLVRYPLVALAIALQPLVWLLRLLTRALARPFGLRARFDPLLHTPEEIRLLVAQGHEQGVVEEDEREMIHGIFEFSQTVAREVMTPRTDMVAVPVDIGLAELLQVVTTEEHSRLPVFDGTLDSIIGVLLVKDLLPILAHRNGDAAGFELRRVMREPYFVPDTKPVDDILAEFRQQNVHLAIVLDEFGGTYGLVTMEDLLEEIVGDINDEYDIAEPDFADTPEGDVLIDGGALISEVNERFDLVLPEQDYDTIGGYIFGALGRVPQVGDEVEAPAAESGAPLARLRVEETEERRILKARLIRNAAVGAAGGEG